MSDEPRSAVDLALERLRKLDAERGVSDRPPTEEQKAAIAEARNLRAAKTAELEILQRSKLATAVDPEDRARLEDDYRRELQRLSDDCERKIRKIRQS